MRYYRITFSKVVNASATHWDWEYEWFEIFCAAANADDARSFGMKVAADNDLKYACTYNLTSKYGKTVVAEKPELRRIDK